MSNRSITNERYTNQQIAACLFIERHKFQDNIFVTNSKKKKNMYYKLCSILCIIRTFRDLNLFHKPPTSRSIIEYYISSL